MTNINKNEDYFNLPLLEENTDYKSTISTQRKHHNNYFLQSINKKHFREYDSFKENNKEINLNNTKRQKQEINIERMFKKMSIVEHLPKSRQIKIFSEGKMSSSLLQNIFKNYYPCTIPPQYSTQIKNQIIHNQMNRIIDNTSEYRKKRLENKRKNMFHLDQYKYKDDLMNYRSSSGENKDIIIEKKKNECCDSEDSTYSNNYWSTLFRNNSEIWLNQSEDEDIYSCNDEKIG